jgi:hypothetical protein
MLYYGHKLDSDSPPLLYPDARETVVALLIKHRCEYERAEMRGVRKVPMTPQQKADFESRLEALDYAILSLGGWRELNEVFRPLLTAG